MTRSNAVPILLTLAAVAHPTAAEEPERIVRGGLTIIHLVQPGPGHPRNSEGAFLQLHDGRILFAYTKFTAGGGDADHAHIAARYSSDGGRTWTSDDVTLLSNEGGQNVMSVSLVRLRDGRIAFFYLRKNSDTDCVPYLRYSSDEARTWSAPIRSIREDGYYVLNNDRVVQIRGGVLVMPIAIHTDEGRRPSSRGRATVWLSGDAGRSWHRAKTVLECPTPSQEGLQEPGIVELRDGSLMMYIRTRLGRQYVSYSRDQGDSWSAPQPSSLLSPQSPALIKRIPKTGDLLLVWNDHSHVDPAIRAVDQPKPGQKPFWGKRTPLSAAISRDDGKTWEAAKNIEDDPDGMYAYPAIGFINDRVLVGYSAGGQGAGHLARARIAYFELSWIY
jgi:sialidase-1